MNPPRSRVRWLLLIPLLFTVGLVVAAVVGGSMLAAGLLACSLAAGGWAWQVAARPREAPSTSVALALDPTMLAIRKQSLMEDLDTLEDAQDLQSGVFEVGAELVGCIDQTDARQRFAAALRRYWSFTALDVWVWERGTWHSVGGAPSGSPPSLDGPVTLPDDQQQHLILDLSTAVSGQAALLLRNAQEQPSLVGRSVEDQRWVAEVLRSQLALSLRRVLLYDELNQLARLDPLTNTHRRWYGESRLRELVDDGAMVAIAMVDIDHFKLVNDRFGHAAGDEVLAQVGKALTTHLRIGDLVSRFGGEEFLLILPDTPPAGALHVAERLRLAVAGISQLSCRVTVSVGIACCRRDDTVTSLMARADAALYRAKETGRNRVIMDDQSDDSRLRTVTRRKRGDTPPNRPAVS
jgi:diguanylate cyclase (GGDEF)-like protein